MAKSMHETSQGPAERDLPYQLQWVVVSSTKPVTGNRNSQIHARNPTGPAERDLLCHKPSLKVFSACHHKIPKAVPESLEATLLAIIFICDVFQLEQDNARKG